MTGPDDFEDFVARRKPVFRRDDDLLEPPPELDRIVLRQAREAIKAEEPEPAYRGASWGMPVAMAATLLVVFSVFLHLGVQKNEPKGEVTVQTVSQPVDALAPAPPPPAPAEAPQAAAADANPVVADLGRSRTRDSAGASGFVPEPEASRYTPPAPPPPVVTARTPADAGRNSTAAAPSEPVASTSAPAWRRDVQSWQAKIQELRAEGKTAEADAEQAEFKRQHRAYAGSPDR